MDQDIADEIEFMIDLLSKSGFYSRGDILEILETEFIEETDDFSQFEIPSNNDFKNENFSRLENAFINMVSKGIVPVHNCGYGLSEGVRDVFELKYHLNVSDLYPEGFCFYTSTDVEYAIFENYLKITFGDFDGDEKKALEIGKIVAECLRQEDFNVVWDETVDSQIVINPITWDKSFDESKDYEIEGAFALFESNWE